MPRRTESLARFDIVVGENIRARRTLLGISQTVLADTIGVSFQQVQKYEKGTNTVSSSRLQAIAVALAMPASSFFERVPPFVLAPPNSSIGNAPELLEFLLSPEGITLNRAFTDIADPRVRNCVVSLVRAIAEQGEE